MRKGSEKGSEGAVDVRGKAAPLSLITCGKDEKVSVITAIIGSSYLKTPTICC